MSTVHVTSFSVYTWRYIKTLLESYKTAQIWPNCDVLSMSNEREICQRPCK